MSQPTANRQLQALLGGLVPADAVVPAVEVLALTDDSRQVRAGSLFFARSGANVDGVRFIGQALEQGAVAVILPDFSMEIATAAGFGDDPRLIPVSDLLAVMAAVASRFHGYPAESLRIIGVTGTNGKTSVARFIATALATVASPVGSIGTLGIGVIDAQGRSEMTETRNTTPGNLRVFEALAGFRDAGARYVVMEVSSHAMTQRRLEAVPVEVAVFTNLTRDHLDYHGDLEAYFEAKALLFEHKGLKEAVINMDDRHGRELLDRYRERVSCWAYGLGDRPWEAGEARLIQARAVRMTEQGLALDVDTPFGEARFRSRLFGTFNASNLLAALGALLALGMPQERALAALTRVEAPPGRMQRIFLGEGRPQVVVDYAHTADALEQVLRALRGHVKGRIWCVFGCGGERDPGKRPAMGAVAERNADVLVITDDNPRGESGDEIVAQILSGLIAPDAVTVERDRRRAIEFALSQAAGDDIVLIAGKGHEEYQEIGGQKWPFSDVQVVRDWAREVAA